MSSTKTVIPRLCRIALIQEIEKPHIDKRCLPVHAEFEKVALVCSSKKLATGDLPSVDPSLRFRALVAESVLLMAPTFFDKENLPEKASLITLAKTIGEKVSQAIKIHAHAQTQSDT